MAVGTPVICTPVGAHKEVIIDGVNGFIVPTGNESEIANKIIKLLTNNDIYYKISSFNIEYVKENFSDEKVMALFEKYLKKV